MKRTASNDSRVECRGVGADRPPAGVIQPTNAQMTSEPKRVLLVDDDPLLVDMHRVWLESDYDVVTASGGVEALEAFDGSVDVALLDRQMPDISGDEVLRTAREEGTECPVAMVTGVEPDVDVAELGFDDYIVKPIDADRLRSVVARMVERSSYDETVREYFAVASKVGALEAAREPGELRRSRAYGELTERLSELARLADEAVVERVDGDPVADFRPFGRIPNTAPDRADRRER